MKVRWTFPLVSNVDEHVARTLIRKLEEKLSMTTPEAKWTDGPYRLEEGTVLGRFFIKVTGENGGSASGAEVDVIAARYGLKRG